MCRHSAGGTGTHNNSIVGCLEVNVGRGGLFETYEGHVITNAEG